MSGMPEGIHRISLLKLAGVGNFDALAGGDLADSYESVDSGAAVDYADGMDSVTKS